MQPINDTVLNPAFIVVFFGTQFVGAVGVLAVYLEGDISSRYGYLFVAGVILYFAGIFIFTRIVFVPMNDYILTWSQTSPPAEWAAIRAKWARWTLFRTIVATIVFVLNLASVVTLVKDRS